MSKHYSFHENAVTVHDSWLSVSIEPKGTFFYSPNDDLSSKWGHLVKRKHMVWELLHKREMPNQFLVQLLLMGVPC